jgi:hypothetical protein
MRRLLGLLWADGHRASSQKLVGAHDAVAALSGNKFVATV